MKTPAIQQKSIVLLAAIGLAFLLPIVRGVDVAKESSSDKNLTLDLGQNVTMQMKWIPAGEFLTSKPSDDVMGSPAAPKIKVAITKPFYMASTEVTRGQFEAFVSQSGYRTEAEARGWGTYWDKASKSNKPIPGRDWRHPGYEQDSDHPVACVTWNDANRFCHWLGEKTGRHVRMPTEAEWEYACRAGTTTRFQWGDKADAAKGWCNLTDETLRQALMKSVPPGITSDNPICSWSDGYAFTSPAGRFKPNAWGLFDMHGNLWEWCADWQGNAYPGDGSSVDPHGPINGTKRVIRGGCWAEPPMFARSLSRVGWEPDNADFGVGFRVCCGEVAPASAASHQPTAPAGTQDAPSPADRIKQIKQLMEQGLIDKQEYDRRVKEILDAI